MTNVTIHQNNRGDFQRRLKNQKINFVGISLSALFVFLVFSFNVSYGGNSQITEPPKDADSHSSFAADFVLDSFLGVIPAKNGLEIKPDKNLLKKNTSSDLLPINDSVVDLRGFEGKGSIDSGPIDSGSIEVRPESTSAYSFDSSQHTSNQAAMSGGIGYFPAVGQTSSSSQVQEESAGGMHPPRCTYHRELSASGKP